MCTLPVFALLRRIAEPTPFLPPFFPPPEISSFWGTSTAITPSGTQEVLLTPAGRKYSTGSSPLTSSLNDPDTLTLLHCFSGSCPSPDISFAPSSLALSCSWEVLQDLGSDHLPILLSVLSLRSIAPTSVPLPSIFRKLAEMALSPTLTRTVLLQRNTSLSLSSAGTFFSSLTLNASKSSIPFGRIKRHPKAWWSAEVESVVSERRKAFAAAHRSNEDRQACISASRRASSVIAIASLIWRD